jgi:hypothetical protein
MSDDPGGAAGVGGVNGTVLVESSGETVSEAPDEGALAAAFDVAAAESRLLGLALALTGERAAALRRLF